MKHTYTPPTFNSSIATALCRTFSNINFSYHMCVLPYRDL